MLVSGNVWPLLFTRLSMMLDTVYYRGESLYCHYVIRQTLSHTHTHTHSHTLTHSHSQHTHTDTSFADVRSSLLEGKQTNNGSSNGAMEITNDPLAKRNSYASFRGGYDSGMPGEDAPDLIK